MTESLQNTERIGSHEQLRYLEVKWDQLGTLWSDFHVHLCDKKKHLNKQLSLATGVVLSDL